MVEQIKIKFLLDRIEKIKEKYLLILSCYKIFDTFNVLKAVNLNNNKELQENMNILNTFPYFFQPISEACRQYFLIEIAKLFDKDKRSLSLYKIINYSESHIGELDKEFFFQYHNRNNRVFGQEDIKDYKELTSKDIKEIRSKISDHEVLIGKIKGYRDQFLAHNDLKKEAVSINKKEIKSLLETIQEIIEFYYYKLDFSENAYDFFSENPAEEFKMIIKSLNNYNKIKKKREGKIID